MEYSNELIINSKIVVDIIEDLFRYETNSLTFFKMLISGRALENLKRKIGNFLYIQKNWKLSYFKEYNIKEYDENIIKKIEELQDFLKDANKILT